REMLGDAAADAGQHFYEPHEAPCLAQLAHFLPLGMIAVLQAPGGVLSDRLQVRGWILRATDVDVSGRHREAGKGSDGLGIVHASAVGAVIGEAAATAAARNRQRLRLDQMQPVRASKLGKRKGSGNLPVRRSPACVRRAGGNLLDVAHVVVYRYSRA